MAEHLQLEESDVETVDFGELQKRWGWVGGLIDENVITSHPSPMLHTGPNLRIPTCPVYQNMTFPHISYTYPVEDRAKCYTNK